MLIRVDLRLLLKCEQVPFLLGHSVYKDAIQKPSADLILTMGIVHLAASEPEAFCGLCKEKC